MKLLSNSVYQNDYHISIACQNKINEDTWEQEIRNYKQSHKHNNLKICSINRTNYCSLERPQIKKQSVKGWMAEKHSEKYTAIKFICSAHYHPSQLHLACS